MLRNKPKGKYSGLTIVMSNPSRFDKEWKPGIGNLLSANGGTLFNDCLQPELNSMLCDVRVMEDTSPWLEGTKCILLLGQAAMHQWCPDTRKNTLNEMRGSLLYVGEIPAIATFFPQDAADFKNYEQSHNELSKEYSGGDELSEDSEDEGDVKAFSLQLNVPITFSGLRQTYPKLKDYCPKIKTQQEWNTYVRMYLPTYFTQWQKM